MASSASNGLARVKIHTAIWVVYFGICYISDLILSPETTRILPELIIFLTHNIYLFYSLLFVIRRFSFRSRDSTFRSFLRAITAVALFFAFKYVSIYFIFMRIYPSEEPVAIQWITAGCLWLINYSIFATAYYYFTVSLKKEKDINRMLNNQLQQEMEKAELEHALLKTQINPHFLYNALSFLYAKSLHLSRELSDGIMRLSEIMRYSFQSNETGGLVQLRDELEHIQNVIILAELRFNSEVYINTDIKGNVDQVTLLPFVLITLVENVLKHGVINEKNLPARILLKVNDEDHFVFSTWNRKRTGPKERSTSIGLDNTMKRLKNTYGDDCTLDIQETDEDFFVALRIPLRAA